MQRQEQVIQLSDHIKNKLKQQRYSTALYLLNNSSDELTETHDPNEYDDNDSVFYTPSANTTHQHNRTFTAYEMKSPLELFFTDRKSNVTPRLSIVEEKYSKQQQPCRECIRRNYIIDYERQRLKRLYNENKNLTEQLHSSNSLNRQYEQDIQKLKHHLRKLNFHLYQYQINLDELKQKITSDKITMPKIDIDKRTEKSENKYNTTSDHLKRLRYEVQMYNRIVDARQKQEQKYIQKPTNFLL